MKHFDSFMTHCGLYIQKFSLYDTTLISQLKKGKYWLYHIVISLLSINKSINKSFIVLYSHSTSETKFNQGAA